MKFFFAPFKYHKAKLCRDDEVEGKRRSEKRNLKLNFSSLSFAHARERKESLAKRKKFESFSYFLLSSSNDNDNGKKKLSFSTLLHSSIARAMVNDRNERSGGRKIENLHKIIIPIALLSFSMKECCK